MVQLLRLLDQHLLDPSSTLFHSLVPGICCLGAASRSLAPSVETVHGVVIRVQSGFALMVLLRVVVAGLQVVQLVKELDWLRQFRCWRKIVLR